MSRDRSETERRRDVERTTEPNESARDTGGRSWGGEYVPFGWPSLPGRSRDEETAAGERYDERVVAGESDYDREVARSRDRKSDESLLDGGLITLIILAGVGLFIFPEPATTALGIALMGVGVLAWLVDLAT